MVLASSDFPYLICFFKNCVCLQTKGMTQQVEHFPCKHEDWSLGP